MCTKFYQIRLGFVEDMTKTFGVFFSVHSVDKTHMNHHVHLFDKLVGMQVFTYYMYVSRLKILCANYYSLVTDY